MLTVIMECRNNEPALAHTLSALVTGAVKGLISDVVILDHASQDGSARVAEAAGCRFHQTWEIGDVIQSIRGEWILLIEPGSRPQGGWIEDILEYVALNERSAQFSPSRYYKRPFIKRMLRRGPPLEFGLLLRKQEAIQLAKSGLPLSEFSQSQKPVRLTAELVPAWALRPAR